LISLQRLTKSRQTLLLAFATVFSWQSQSCRSFVLDASEFAKGAEGVDRFGPSGVIGVKRAAQVCPTQTLSYGDPLRVLIGQ
jgi:hypothetical protein